MNVSPSHFKRDMVCGELQLSKNKIGIDMKTVNYV